MFQAQLTPAYLDTVARKRAHQHSALTKQAKGRFAEEFVLRLYEKARFEILAHDQHIGRAQIDLITKRNQCVHFVEVKYRKHLQDAISAARPSQLQRIARAAEIYMRQYPDMLWAIDLVAVDQHMNWHRIDNIPLHVH